MEDQWLQLLACVRCGGPLGFSGTNRAEDNPLDGELACEKCDYTAPVNTGIPNFLEVDQAAGDDANLKRQEIQKRDSEAHQYDDQFSDFATRLEESSVLREIAPKPDETILELGIGTGRLAVAYASKVHRFVGVDFSRTSLEIAARRLRAIGAKFLLIQGDVCHLPFRAEVFDKAVSCQVFEHLPSPAARQTAFADVQRVLQVDGQFTLTVYHDRLLHRAQRRFRPTEDNAKQGLHAGDIYFYRFTSQELRDELNRCFKVQRLRGIQLAPQRLFSALGNVGILAERMLQHTPLASLSARLLLATARKRPQRGI